MKQQSETCNVVTKALHARWKRLATINKPIQEPPSPAPGWHDPKLFPELDVQQVPMEVVDGSVGVPAADPVEAEREEEGAGSVGSAGVPAADPKMETKEEKDTGSVGSAGVPATDPAPDEAVESEFEPDWKATRK